MVYAQRDGITPLGRAFRMLVLTRRLNESITIGDDVEITVIEVRGDQVRLGIAAPRGIAVHRKEIWLQIAEENKAAAAIALVPEMQTVGAVA